MKRVYQTCFGPKEGNCFEACIASLLELSISDIPPFGKNIGTWSQELLRWLRPKGLCYVELTYTDPEAIYWIQRSGYSVLSGPSPRGGCLHAVIAYKGTIVHDPHPDHSGLSKIESIGFLCLTCGEIKS